MELKIDWDGQGLPPVGAQCEWLASRDEWKPCRIVGRDGSFAVLVYAETNYFARGAASFRRIKSPEQIAAEAYAAAVHQLMHDAGILGSAFEHDPEAMAWAQSAINQGWIKP